MECKIVKRVWVAAVAAGICVSASAASAAVFNITSLTGNWVEYTPTDVYGLNIQNTTDSSRIAWGDPANGVDQSSFVVDWIIPPAVEVDTDVATEFDLGVFTHNNFWLYGAPQGSTAITAAVLDVAMEFMIGSASFLIEQSFTFDFEETLNFPDNNGPCAFGGTAGSGVNIEGCADRIQFTRNEGTGDSVIVDGVEYTLDISGFMVGDQLASFFLTEEKQSSEAVLVGRIVANELPNVPLPAAGWLLLGGIGGLAAFKRVRRKA